MERLTKIVCTLGPSSCTTDVIGEMVASGMDIARLNFSHGTHGEHLSRLMAARAAAKSLGRKVMVLQDLPGPKLRVGILPEQIILQDGAMVVLSSGNALDGAIPVPDSVIEALSEGSTVLVADGKIKMSVLKLSAKTAECEVLRGGVVSSGKGVNILDSSTEARAVTVADEAHMRFGCANRVDYIAVSFVRTAEDIAYAKAVLAKLGHRIPVIAKIEKPEAMKDLKGIVAEADAVMVARGDLGVEIGIENVPFAQKSVIKESNAQGKPVITATQMLASMVGSSVPTRAEVSDVINSMIDGTDAIMTSEETAVGRNPVDVVRVMDMLLESAETTDKKIRSRLESRNSRNYMRFINSEFELELHKGNHASVRPAA